jgi:hypothetical protein
MDIICASCGKHFQNIESVREHARSHKDKLKDLVNEPVETPEPLTLQECPHCHKTSLTFNSQTLIFECLNWDCRHLITKIELDEFSKSSSERINKTEITQSVKEDINIEIDGVLFTKINEQKGDKLNFTVNPEICGRCKKNRDSCGFKDKSESSMYCSFRE